MSTNVVKTFGLNTLVFIMIIFALTACGGNDSGEAPDTGGSDQPAAVDKPENREQAPEEIKPPSLTKEPLELVIYDRYVSSKLEIFMERYGNTIQQKYPNLSFKYLLTAETPIEELAVTNQRVDLYVTQLSGVPALREAGYTNFDITGLAKQFNMDLSRFEALDMIKAANGGVLNGLPYTLLSHVLTYNKDVFDKFAEPDLRDGMTWDEVYDVARRLTREDGGVNYIGFAYNQLATYLEYNPYGQILWDSATGKATMDTGKWPEIFRTLTSFYEIPGTPYLSSVVDAWGKEKRIGMILNYSSQFGTYNTLITEDLNFDIVQPPSFKDLPGVGSAAQPLFYGVSATSPYKNEAFAVIDVILSDAVVEEGIRIGRVPPIRVEGMENIFGLETPVLQGKNVAGLFPDQFGPATPPPPDGVNLRSTILKAFVAVAQGTKDINTALREASEEADKLIAEANSK